MARLVRIKVRYDYHSNKRITPVYLSEDDLLEMSYDEFKRRLLEEVPHLQKLSSTTSSVLRLTVMEDDITEVDLSPLYFSVQMKGILEKDSSLLINVTSFDSPAAVAPMSVASSKNKAYSPQNVVVPTESRARKSLNEPLLLPIQRYVKKQQSVVDEVENEMKKKREKMQKLEERLKSAAAENAGYQTACGQCHLRLGHTKRNCSFSPCQSAYSCGMLSRHNKEKSEFSSLQKEIERLNKKLETTSTEMENAVRASDKVSNSVTKHVEDLIIQELPDRYTSFGGLRNWKLLNKDVATIQKHLHNTLPSRTNVCKLLHEVIIKGAETSTSTSNVTATSTSKISDHRMSSHKRLLSEEYAINFPTDRYRKSRQDNTCTFSRSQAQEQDDFEFALKLQQEEVQSQSQDRCNSPVIEHIEESSTQVSCTNNVMECDGREANAATALMELAFRRSR